MAESSQPAGVVVDRGVRPLTEMSADGHDVVANRAEKESKVKVTEYIPAEKLGQFHEILCATGGRYLRNPLSLWQLVEVHYEPGDYKAQREAWARCVTPIRETQRNQRRRVGVAALWLVGLTWMSQVKRIFTG